MRQARWLSLLLVSCGAPVVVHTTRPGPGEPVAMTPQPASAPVAGQAPLASASASPIAPSASASAVREAPLLPAEPFDVPALFAELFDDGRRWSYAYTSYVDPHDPDPKADRTPERGVVSCAVAAVKRLRGALVSEVRCGEPVASKGGEMGVIDRLDAVYVVTARGLYVVEEPPTTDAEVAEAAAGEPYLTAAPKAFKRSSKNDGDGFAYEEGASVSRKRVSVGGGAVDAVCRNDFHTQFYGRSETRCLAPGQGLVSRVMKGRGGPSEETLVLRELIRRPPSRR